MECRITTMCFRIRSVAFLKIIGNRAKFYYTYVSQSSQLLRLIGCGCSLNFLMSPSMVDYHPIHSQILNTVPSFLLPSSHTHPQMPAVGHAQCWKPIQAELCTGPSPQHSVCLSNWKPAPVQGGHRCLSKAMNTAEGTSAASHSIWGFKNVN